MPALSDSEEQLAAALDATASARSVLTHAMLALGPDVAEIFAALIGAAILVTVACPLAAPEMLRVGAEMLTKAEAIASKRTAARAATT